MIYIEWFFLELTLYLSDGMARIPFFAHFWEALDHAIMVTGSILQPFVPEGKNINMLQEQTPQADALSNTPWPLGYSHFMMFIIKPEHA